MPRRCRGKIREYTENNEVPLYIYTGTGGDLGLALGKPFSVSAMAVIDPGDSSILELGESYK